ACPPFLITATAPSDVSTLSLHDALPISCSMTATSAGIPCGFRRGARTTWSAPEGSSRSVFRSRRRARKPSISCSPGPENQNFQRSEEHTSELQSPYDIVCRLLLEKKKTYYEIPPQPSTPVNAAPASVASGRVPFGRAFQSWTHDGFASTGRLRSQSPQVSIRARCF